MYVHKCHKTPQKEGESKLNSLLFSFFFCESVDPSSGVIGSSVHDFPVEIAG